MKCFQTEPLPCPENKGAVSWQSREGLIYNIFVHGASTDQQGDYHLEIVSPTATVQPPSNPPSPSPPSPTAPSPASDDDSSSVPIGAIIGGALGGVLITCVAVVAIWLLKSRSNARDSGSGKEIVDQTKDASHGSELAREGESTSGYTSATPTTSGPSSNPASVGTATRVSHDPPTASEEMKQKNKKKSQPAPVQFKDQCQSVLGVPLATAAVVEDDDSTS